MKVIKVIYIHCCGECPDVKKTVNGYVCGPTGRHLETINNVKMGYKFPSDCVRENYIV